MGGESDQVIIGAAEEKLKTVYQAMDAALAHSPYLSGTELTLADLAFVQYTDFLLQSKCEHLVFFFEHVRRWWHGISQRDSYKNPLSAIS
jgi:glutathione S-transferase